MTLDEVAAYLKLHPVTVRRLARERKIPAVKVGNGWRVKRELLDRFIEQRSVRRKDAHHES
jgi:excisionase family DNA binding protein